MFKLNSIIEFSFTLTPSSPEPTKAAKTINITNNTPKAIKQPKIVASKFLKNFIYLYFNLLQR